MILEANVTIMVSDVDRAIEFYTKILGLGLRERYGSKYAEVQVDGFIIALHLKNSKHQVPAETANLFIGFRVEKLESSIADLKIKGAKVSGEVEEGVAGRFFYFVDPDGNPLYLWQKKSQEDPSV